MNVPKFNALQSLAPSATPGGKPEYDPALRTVTLELLTVRQNMAKREKGIRALLSVTNRLPDEMSECLKETISQASKSPADRTDLKCARVRQTIQVMKEMENKLDL